MAEDEAFATVLAGSMRRSLITLIVVPLLVLLQACSGTPSATPATLPTPAGPDPALRDSRLLGLALGDSPARAVEVLSAQEGAVLMRQLSPVHAERLLTTTVLDEDPRAQELTGRWSQPGASGQYIARLDDEQAALQVWITVCNGAVRGLQASYSPGSAADAAADWLLRFPGDHLSFPPDVPAVDSEQAGSAAGQRYTRQRRFQPQPRAQMIESLRVFQPALAGKPPVNQLIAQRLEALDGCPEIEDSAALPQRRSAH